MANFNYSVTLDEQGNVVKKVRLIRYNSKILAFNISKPETQSFYNNVEEFLSSVEGCDARIFDDLTGENIFEKFTKEVNNQVKNEVKPGIATRLMERIIPEKQSQLRFE